MAFRRASCRALAALFIALAAPAGFAQSTVTLNATSGTGTISTNYTTSGGLTLDLGFFAEYLVVGGGGGGGGSGDSSSAWGGGGGGAGGLLTGTTTISATSYTVTVGGGGAGGQFSATAANQMGSNGANSLFGSFATGTGGGGGGRFKVAGNDGGSGGGGGGRGTGNDLRTPGGNGIAGQGNNGGASRDDDSSGRSAGGGGGGAGAVGGTGGTNVTTAGNGGAGLASSITGTSVIYAGGGGGGAWDTFDGETAGSGGSGGGGAGSTNSSATAGTDNFGGGGGGVGTNGAGGRGGSGIVIVRYQGASLGSIGGTVTSGSGSAAGYTLHTFTTSGTSTGTSALNLSGIDMNTRLGVTLTGTISGTGSLTFAGPGTLTLAANNTFTGDTRIASGTLAISNRDALFYSTLDMNASDSGAISFINSEARLGGLKGSRNLQIPGDQLNIGSNDENTTYTGSLSGTGRLVKWYDGTLTLSGSNSFTGTTYVAGGTLVIANANALAGSTLGVDAYSGGVISFSQNSSLGGLTSFGSPPGSFDNGSYTLTIGGNNANTEYNGGISGAGGLTKAGTGTLTLSGSTSFTGDTRIASGTLAIGHANALASSTLDMNASDSGSVTFSQASNLGGLKGSRDLANGGNMLTIGGNNQSTTYSGVLSGTGGVTKIGTGALTLSGNNTYSGLTTVSSGTLAIGSGGTSGSIAGDIANSGAVVFNRSTSNTYAGSISGTGSLTKQGTGSILTLSGSSSFTGDTRVAAGFLTVSNANALAGSTLDMNASDSGSIIFSQGSSIGGLTGSRNLANGGNTLSIGGNNASTTYSGVLSGAGGLTKQGTGTLTLTGNNTYSGLTTVSVGTLAIGAGGTTGAIAGNIANSGAVVFNRSNALTYTGSISGTGGLTKQGAGALTLTGSNTYTGPTTVSSGTLLIGSGGASGSIVGDIANSGAVVFNRYDSLTYAGSISGTGGLTKQGGGTLTLTGSSSCTGDTRVTQGTLVVANANALSASTLDWASATGITFMQASTLGGLKGANSFSNSGYTLTIGGNGQSTAYSGRLTGAGGLTKTGAGTLTLAGGNSYTGDTRIASGTLAVANTYSLGMSTLDLNAIDSGSIIFSQASVLGGLKGSRNLSNGGNLLGIGANNQSTTYSGVLSGTGGLVKFGAGTLTLTGNNTYTGSTTVSKGTLAIGDGGTAGSLVGAVKLTPGTSLVFNRSDASTYAGNITGTGSLTKLGVGTLTLTGSNTFKGDTTVSAGTLVLGSGNALATTAAVTVASGATLDATVPIRIGYIDSQGTVTGSNNLTATLTVTRSGNIGGITDGTDSQGTFAAGIVKLGTGTSTVNSANTYTGLTWVKEGTLAAGLANAFAAGSDLTVDSPATFDRAGYSQTVADADIDGVVANSSLGGLLTIAGTLSGTGVLNGDVLVNGVHAPGNSPGIQTFNGDLTYGSGAVINWELIANSVSTSPSVFDQVFLGGLADLTFSGANVLSLSFDSAGSLVDWTDVFWDVNQTWTLFDLNGGSTTGFNFLALGGSLLDSTGSSLNAATRGSFSLGQTGQDVVLLYTAASTGVPEIDPAGCASVVALVTGALGLLERRRRRA
jgi:fibronectin-binding autotransporter adhesin